MEYIPESEAAAGLTQEPSGLALGEIEHAAQRGSDVSALRAELAQCDGDDSALLDVYRRALALPPPADWPFVEPETDAAILASLPTAPPPSPRPPDFEGRLRGAWQGRIAGNLVGKPLEIGPTRSSIRGYLRSVDSYPLRGYVPFPSGADETALGQWGYEGITAGRIHGAPRDDDLDYTVLGLELLEQHGHGYSTRDVAVSWLTRLPIYQVFTAERNAYQNLVRGVALADVGSHRNPFREWIGALIRADIFGFVHPGDPRAAAIATLPDAKLSHRANGAYGAMWAAALLATAFTSRTPEESVVASLAHVPPRSRLASEITRVVDDHSRGLDWEEAIDGIESRHPGMSWVHVLNNSGALAAAILWGEGDPMATIALAVQAGLDTDSIGATAGAWAGAFVGERGLPAVLVDPLDDSYRCGVFGVGTVSIADLARRTHLLATGD